MNTLLMLVLTVQAPAADLPPVIQTQMTYSAPVPSAVPMAQSMPPVVSTSEAAPSDSWWSRFRNRPGLLSRLRDFFGWSSSSDTVVGSPGVTYSSVPGPTSWSEGRLSPVPVLTPSVTSPPPLATPSLASPPVSTGSPSSQVPTSVDVAPQRMPVGR